MWHIWGGMWDNMGGGMLVVGGVGDGGCGELAQIGSHGSDVFGVSTWTERGMNVRMNVCVFVCLN